MSALQIAIAAGVTGCMLGAFVGYFVGLMHGYRMAMEQATDEVRKTRISLEELRRGGAC